MAEMECQFSTAQLCRTQKTGEQVELNVRTQKKVGYQACIKRVFSCPKVFLFVRELIFK